MGEGEGGGDLGDYFTASGRGEGEGTIVKELDAFVLGPRRAAAGESS